MRVCPTCQTRYLGDDPFCSKDGQATVEAESLDGNWSDPLLNANIGNYRVTAKLGEGGMGTVYRAEHPTIGRVVAVKVLHEAYARRSDTIERFFNEAKSVNQIKHENIVDIIDFGILPDHRPYFVMEFLEGCDLDGYLRKRGRLSVLESIEIMIPVLSALKAAHEEDIIHRDLKPENIFLAERKHGGRQVKLLDFGIAKLLDEKARDNDFRTKTNSLIGTPAYMAPEQASGKRDVDQRADVYAAGLILYELLVGEPPFSGETALEIVHKQLKEPPTPVRNVRPEIPEELDTLILWTLEKDRDKRIQTADELGKRLKSVLARVSMAPRPSSSPGVAVAAASAKALPAATPRPPNNTPRPNTVSRPVSPVPPRPPGPATPDPGSSGRLAAPVLSSGAALPDSIIPRPKTHTPLPGSIVARPKMNTPLPGSIVARPKTGALPAAPPLPKPGAFSTSGYSAVVIEGAGDLRAEATRMAPVESILAQQDPTLRGRDLQSESTRIGAIPEAETREESTSVGASPSGAASLRGESTRVGGLPVASPSQDESTHIGSVPSLEYRDESTHLGRSLASESTRIGAIPEEDSREESTNIGAVPQPLFDLRQEPGRGGNLPVASPSQDDSTHVAHVPGPSPSRDESTQIGGALPIVTASLVGEATRVAQETPLVEPTPSESPQTALSSPGKSTPRSPLVAAPASDKVTPRGPLAAASALDKNTPRGPLAAEANAPLGPLAASVPEKLVAGSAAASAEKSAPRAGSASLAQLSGAFPRPQTASLPGTPPLSGAFPRPPTGAGLAVGSAPVPPRSSSGSLPGVSRPRAGTVPPTPAPGAAAARPATGAFAPNFAPVLPAASATPPPGTLKPAAPSLASASARLPLPPPPPVVSVDPDTAKRKALEDSQDNPALRSEPTRVGIVDEISGESSGESLRSESTQIGAVPEEPSNDVTDSRPRFARPSPPESDIRSEPTRMASLDSVAPPAPRPDEDDATEGGAFDEALYKQLLQGELSEQLDGGPTAHNASAAPVLTLEPAPVVVAPSAPGPAAKSIVELKTVSDQPLPPLPVVPKAAPGAPAVPLAPVVPAPWWAAYQPGGPRFLLLLLGFVLFGSAVVLVVRLVTSSAPVVQAPSVPVPVPPVSPAPAENAPVSQPTPQPAPASAPLLSAQEEPAPVLAPASVAVPPVKKAPRPRSDAPAKTSAAKTTATAAKAPAKTTAKEAAPATKTTAKPLPVAKPEKKKS